MKHIIRYRFMTIPQKMNGELRITIDDRIEYNSNYDGGKSTSITIFPIIAINIARSSETDETGKKVRAPWNPNDSLGMTRFNIPVFLRELKAMMDGMKTPSLYTYKGEVLEVNTKEAEKNRHVFVIGSTTVELSAVVIQNLDDQMVEGVKIKFNNEQSTVALTLNEMEALIHSVETLPVDMLAFQLYQTYSSNKSYRSRSNSYVTQVDIKPLENDKTAFKEFK